MIRILMIGAIAATMWIPGKIAVAENIQLKLQSITRAPAATDKRRTVIKEETWELSQTAIIVCDVWDYHHCLNAVRRLEEFAPRLDQVLKAARDRGAIVIHAPSDCMPAYAHHPARQRALQIPQNGRPADVKYWCSRLPDEGRSYPIDQSDGGEDDDPQEHAAWAAKLKSLGRNPGMPWKKQSDLITINANRDFITDRGEEVWNILEKHAIRNVILTGVHCNMCVLGRPFGLRQMVRNGKHVVLMRDMTDSMYSPKSWPYVDHFTGHDRVLAYVEENICPTITSNQILGGQPFRWKTDQRPPQTIGTPASQPAAPDPTKHWATVNVGTREFVNSLQKQANPVWYRGALQIPADHNDGTSVGLEVLYPGKVQVWLNGHELQPTRASSGLANAIRFTFPKEHVAENDYNLIVAKTIADSTMSWSPDVIWGQNRVPLESYWQVRIGNDPSFSNIPLPAKFGIGPDAVLTVRGPRGPRE